MITIIAVGKLKKDEYRALTDDFIRRTNRYMKTALIEVNDEDCDANRDLAIRKEGEAILSKIPQRAFVVACTPEGRLMTSEAFADRLQDIFNSSVSDICFIIGGSAGLSDAVKERSDLKLSFSSFTFAHNLFRVILAEQIYRAFKILNHETYHK